MSTEQKQQPGQLQLQAVGSRRPDVGVTPAGSHVPLAFVNNSTAPGLSASSFCATSMRDSRIFRSSVWNCTEGGEEGEREGVSQGSEEGEGL